MVDFTRRLQAFFIRLVSRICQCTLDSFMQIFSSVAIGSQKGEADFDFKENYDLFTPITLGAF